MQRSEHSSVTDAPYRIAFQVNQTPAHLAVVCAMAGVAFELRDELVVADLGCGRGYVANVLAAANAGWRVLGIDHSAVQIAEATLTATQAGLDNTRFIEADLGRLDDTQLDQLPELDVVLLHGLWTWVSDAVRAGITRLLKRRLRPGGLVYVGYNALPGSARDFGLQRLLWQLAAPALRGGAGSVAAAEEAMTQLRQMASVLSLPPTPMLQRLLSDPPLLEPAFVAHEFLTPHWCPVFHSELCEALAPAKLDFVGSCNLFEAVPKLFLEPARLDLLRAAPTADGSERLKDLFLPRSFRADVFVRGARPVDRALALDALVLAAAGPLAQQSPSLGTGLSEVALPQPLWDILRPALGAGVQTLGALRGILGAASPPASELLALLVGTQQVLPLWSSGQATAQARRFQHVAAQRYAQQGQARGHFALAAPGAAGGLPAQALDLALVHALLEGHAAQDTDGLVSWLRPMLSGAERQVLSQAVADRLQAMRPVWQRFGVL